MEWIRYADQTPVKNQHILIWGKDFVEPYAIHYNVNNHLIVLLIGNLDYITHWMPIPEPPKEK